MHTGFVLLFLTFSGRYSFSCCYIADRTVLRRRTTYTDKAHVADKAA